MATLDPPISQSYVEHARQNENVFKQANNFVEEIELNLDNILLPTQIFHRIRRKEAIHHDYMFYKE